MSRVDQEIPLIPGYMAMAEVAKVLGVYRTTIYHWHDEGKIKIFRLGNRLAIPVEEVERLKREREIKP